MSYDLDESIESAIESLGSVGPARSPAPALPDQAEKLKRKGKQRVIQRGRNMFLKC
jgi:hypothetical protein